MKREDWDRKYAEREQLWSAKPNRFLVAEARRSRTRPRARPRVRRGPERDLARRARLGRHRRRLLRRRDREGARAGARASGVDVEFVCADLLDYEPERGAFDLVLVLYLQHSGATSAGSCSRGRRRALAPGGTLRPRRPRSDEPRPRASAARATPIVLYTPDDIAAELPGLEIEKAERVLRDVDGADRPAIDALVRARRPPLGAPAHSNGPSASSRRNCGELPGLADGDERVALLDDVARAARR